VSGWEFEVKKLTEKVEQERELARRSCEDQGNELKVYFSFTLIFVENTIHHRYTNLSMKNLIRKYQNCPMKYVSLVKALIVPLA